MATGALSIKLRCASWQQLSTIYKRDLTRGAMFLKASTPPANGTQVRIDLTLPSGSVIVLTGTVEKAVTDPQRGQGVELKLAPIPAGSIWMIESALATEASKPSPQVTDKSGPLAAIGGDLVEAESDLVRALLAEAESLKKLNPFLVLGIGYEATDNDVRAAFGELTKRYHPDRFARYESTELRNVAAEIFILIRDAYRRICDEPSRSQVLTQLGRAVAPRAVPTPHVMRGTATPPAGVPRVSQRIPSAQIPALARPEPQVTTPLQAQPNPTQQPTTKPGSPLLGRELGNENTTKKPEPVKPELLAKGTPTAPPSPALPRTVPTGSPSPVHETNEHGALEELLDRGKPDEALAQYKILAKKHPNDRVLRAGVELCEGLIALAARDRLEAAQRFEAALEIDPSNERAARELAEMRRQATNERKGLLSRLMGKKE